MFYDLELFCLPFATPQITIPLNTNAHAQPTELGGR